MGPCQASGNEKSRESRAELFDLQSNPYEVSFRQWTVRWWQWFLSQPRPTNPANYRAGTETDAGVPQPYPQVWFMASTTGGFAERWGKVPRNRAILCPIINFEISTAEVPHLETDEELMDYARRDVDKIEKLAFRIDGLDIEELKNLRVESGPFDVTLPEDNICGVKAGPTRAAADGYWLFFKPLPSGEHEIRFSGSCLAGTINIGTTYHISIQ